MILVLHKLGLLRVLDVSQFLDLGAVEGKLVLKGGNLTKEIGTVLAHAPVVRKLIRSLGHLTLVASFHDALIHVCQGREEISRRLSGGAVIAHIGKVLLGDLCGAKEDLATLVEYHDLVEFLQYLVRMLCYRFHCYEHSTHVVGKLTGLVQGHHGTSPTKLSSKPERLDELERRCTVETTRTVVPALNGTLVEDGLGNTNSLPLTSTDTSDEVVANLGVDGPSNAKHGHDGIAQMLRVFMSRGARYSV